MGSQSPPVRSMPSAAFLTLRSELLLASTMMSCEQALDLADLLHTAIRMRKPGRPLRNLDHLFREEAENLRSGPWRKDVDRRFGETGLDGI